MIAILAGSLNCLSVVSTTTTRVLRLHISSTTTSHEVVYANHTSVVGVPYVRTIRDWREHLVSDLILERVSEPAHRVIEVILVDCSDSSWSQSAAEHGRERRANDGSSRT